MGSDLRMLQAGASWSEKYDSLEDLRRRGTFHQIPSLASGRLRALRLTVNGGYYQVNAPPWSDIGSGSVTISSCFRTNGGGQEILVGWGAGGGSACFAIAVGILSPAGGCGIRDVALATAETVGTTDVTDGLWHSATMVIDRTAQRLRYYRDGSEEGVAADIAGIGALLPMDKGPEVYFFSGLGATYLEVADVLVFPRVLTPAEILGL